MNLIVNHIDMNTWEYDSGICKNSFFLLWLLRPNPKKEDGVQWLFSSIALMKQTNILSDIAQHHYWLDLSNIF